MNNPKYWTGEEEMKATGYQPRPFVPYVPPKSLMEAHAKAIAYQRIPGYTAQNRTLNK